MYQAFEECTSLFMSKMAFLGLLRPFNVKNGFCDTKKARLTQAKALQDLKWFFRVKQGSADLTRLFSVKNGCSEKNMAHLTQPGIRRAKKDL